MRYLFVLVALFLSNSASAQVRSTEVIGTVYSKEHISYTHLDVTCLKNNSNAMEYNFSGDVQTVKVDREAYRLVIAPIRLSLPVISEMVYCHINLSFYLPARKKFLKFKVLGSHAPMSQKELRTIIGNERHLSEMLSLKLSETRLVFDPKVHQGFSLIFRP